MYVSPAFARFGFDLDLWYSDPEIWIKVIHPQDRERVFRPDRCVDPFGEEVDYEYRIIDAKRRDPWVRDRGCLIRDKKGNVLCREGVILDITDRKKVKEALRISEERYRDLFENANDIHLRTRPQR
jgi:PAS domain-containing protein